MRDAANLVLMVCLFQNVALAQQWQVLPEQSTLGFTASYDGVAFDGQFEEFTLELQFDPNQPDKGKLSSRVDTASVNTNSRDRDEALADPAWFHFSAYPQATFTSQQFRKLDAGTFEASGTLMIRDQQRQVTFPFNWRPLNSDQARVHAEFTLDRRDFEIGNGEWEEDETIGFAVNVKISLVLKKML